MFSHRDIDQIERRGMNLMVIQRQIDRFINGFPFIHLVRPAVTSDGILKFDDKQLKFYQEYFELHSPSLQIVKFVPASGAASRMFKHLFEFREKYTNDEAGKNLLMADQGFNSAHYFITHLGQLAFFNDLAAVLAVAVKPVEQLLESTDYNTIIGNILFDNGLNYSNLPKALIKFHHYKDGSRTAAEEHLVEAAVYAKDDHKTARIHFTISPEHREKFAALFSIVKRKYELAYDAAFDISFSIQKTSTDTIAVDGANIPVRNPDGSLLFRPGGHGALLENLNEIDADLVFIKNIDNIVPDRLKGTTVQYKKVLAGYLLHLKNSIYGYLAKLKQHKTDPTELQKIVDFAKHELFLDFPPEFNELSYYDRVDFIYKMMDRPIRVCGMVKNQGEPGGGPFWVMSDDQQLSLQIVESSQVNMKNPEQKAIVAHSTHFNPVDLVCSIRNYEGIPFDLNEYTDENTGFISYKSAGGKTLKALELPGLWNGAMAKWITIFIDVPVITFNPVKTVNDLLRTEHLPQ